MKPDQTVMHAKRYEVFCCSPNDTLLKAAKQMVEKNVSGLVVQDKEGYLNGVITRTDLIRVCLNIEHWTKEKVKDHMIGDVVTVSVDDPLEVVAELLLNEHIHRVVVVKPEGENSRPLAVVSDADLIFHMVKECESSKSSSNFD